LFSDGNGSNNAATGVYALYTNTTGWYNNAVGAYALANGQHRALRGGQRNVTQRVHRKVEQQEMAITELRSNAAKREATIALQQHEIKA
jgi:hypothetical protein